MSEAPVADVAVDAVALREEVKSKYREVAVDPGGEFHFHTGRYVAARFGYDAVSMVAAGWHQQHQSRRSMREWLAALKDYDGASGRIGFSPGRRVNDELSLLKIASDGRLVPLVIDDLPDMGVPEDDLPALDMLDNGTEFEFADRDSLFLGGE